jgi:hypothetical protein
MVLNLLLPPFKLVRISPMKIIALLLKKEKKSSSRYYGREITAFGFMNTILAFACNDSWSSGERVYCISIRSTCR